MFSVRRSLGFQVSWSKKASSFVVMLWRPSSSAGTPGTVADWR